MPTFLLTARHDINRANGLHINKGQPFYVNIPMNGITPNNLFNNSRCQNELYQQLHQVGGINLPPTDPFFKNRGNWDIKMII